jgi:hypothetical protein
MEITLKILPSLFWPENFGKMFHTPNQNIATQPNCCSPCGKTVAHRAEEKI